MVCGLPAGLVETLTAAVDSAVLPIMVVYLAVFVCSNIILLYRLISSHAVAVVWLISQQKMIIGILTGQAKVLTNR
jgi:hypothetical protein